MKWLLEKGLWQDQIGPQAAGRHAGVVLCSLHTHLQPETGYEQWRSRNRCCSWLCWQGNLAEQGWVALGIRGSYALDAQLWMESGEIATSCIATPSCIGETRWPWASSNTVLTSGLAVFQASLSTGGVD